MQHTHLRAVEPDPAASDAPAGPPQPPESGAPDRKRNKPRTRPSKSIPSDRMRFDTQLKVLQTIGRLSGPGKRPIDAEALSKAMNGEVSHYTVSLSHGFFLDAGWLEKRGRGLYAATDALVDYGRRLSVDPGNPAKAIEALRAPVLQSWFWLAIEAQLVGGAPLSEVLVTLMSEAEVGDEHKQQLKNLLDFLAYVGLVNIADGVVTVPLVPGTEGGGPAHPEAGGAPNEPESESAMHGPGVQDATPATRRGDGRPPGLASVMQFGFSFSLTVDDLTKLTPEQIRATFEAVGVLMAVKAAQ